jgi:tetratricopeptide (TPR) repeat protein
VGEAKYAAKDFVAAAKSYFLACDSAPNPELLNKSLHKLAWSCFERGQFGAAQEAFDRQIAVMQERITATGGKVDPAAPLEPLAADAMLMIVECRFQQHQYQLALESFDVAIEQRAASESLRAMLCVHAAQSAAETKNWQRAFELADRALRDFPKSQWADEARCERGIALVELGRLDDAQRDLVAVAAQHNDLLQVKSELALGRIHVAKQDHDNAVRMFFKVAYGHGGTAAPASFHPWQAEAIFAAARVLEDSGRQDSARKLYQELVDNYPASERTALARQSLEGNLRR